MGSGSTFDWFTLDRQHLFDMLYVIKERIVNKSLSTSNLHNKLVYEIRKQLPIKFKKVISPKVEKGWVYVGGSYYSDKDEDGEKSITIEFCYNNDKQKIEMTSKRFDRLCMGFADTMLHEIIHMRQHRRRNWKTLPEFPSTSNRLKQRQEQEYLGCRDEIDAYAFNIACELHDKFHGKQTQAIKYMNKNHRGCRKNNSYKMYITAFGHNHSHPVVKQLKKKIMSYWPQAKIGKPYRNSEWINY